MIVLEAGKQNGYALRYAALELKVDHNFMLEAVRQIDMHSSMRHQSTRRTVRS